MAALLASAMDVRAAVALRLPIMDALSALPAAFCALHSTAFSLHSLLRSPCRLHVSVSEFCEGTNMCPHRVQTCHQ